MTALPPPKERRTELDRLIEDFLEHLEIERNCSPLTIRNYRHYLGRFSNWLKQNDFKAEPSSIDLEKIKKYRVFLARFTAPNSQSLSLSTQAYHVIALRAFLRWLIKNDQKTLAPEKVDLPKSESRSLKFLSAEQIERLLSQPLPSAKTGLRDKAILEVLFSTGLRVSELVKLDRDQIDLRRREFGVVGKGGRARVVFLSERAVKWLKEYLKTRADDEKALFINYKPGKLETESPTPKRLTPRSIERLMEKYSKIAGLPIMATPHTMRHSYATDLLNQGVDIRTVQELLGHQNIATTQIYTHVTNKRLRDVHRQFHSGKNLKE